MTRIVLDRVSKTYPSKGTGGEAKPTIPGLDLVIKDGEFLVLVGPSGCGKSTALRLIAGLEDITSGRIRFDDRDVTRLEARQRNIAFVFQNYALYPHMTVAGNIGFPLRMSRTPKDTIDEKVNSAARLLKLDNELMRRPGQLSGGQSQRVAMGRAIVRDPDVFLMDEPLSNLDAMLRVEMRAEISSLQRTLGKTMVYVTHDGEEAMTMGHRVAVLRGGVLQQVGAPGDLYATPQNAFVAGFVGNPQMNFVPGRVWRERDGWQVGFGQVRMTLPEPTVARHLRLAPQEGSPLIVGFRPETVRMDPQAGDGEALDIQVAGVQHLGRETRVLFAAPEQGVGVGEIADLDQITNKVGRSGELLMTLTPPQRVIVGESLRLRIDPLTLHLFDAAGKAL